MIYCLPIVINWPFSLHVVGVASQGICGFIDFLLVFGVKARVKENKSSVTEAFSSIFFMVVSLVFFYYYGNSTFYRNFDVF